MNIIYNYEVTLKSKEGQSLILFIDTLNQDDLQKLVSKKLKSMPEYDMYDYKIEKFELKNKELFEITKLKDLTELFFVSFAIHRKESNFSRKEIEKSLLKINQGWNLELALKFLKLNLDKVFWFKLNNKYDFDNKLKNNIGFVKKTSQVRYTGEFEGIIVDSLFNEQMFDLNEVLPITKNELIFLESKVGSKINVEEILTEDKYFEIQEYLNLLSKNYLDDFSDIDDYLV